MKMFISLVITLLVFSFSLSQKIDQKKLEQLVSISAQGHSDGLIIYKDGQIIHENYFGKKPSKIDIKSVTKSITNLAIGYLVTHNKLDVTQKVYEFYPEWKQENKQDITVRHLLTHTSGLLDSDFSLVETAPDIVKMALASDLTHPVGEYYVYNNKSVNLLVGIVEKVDGRKIDELMREEIFRPLGITDFTWPKDQAGNPYAMAFLQMYPKDLLKIGQLMLNKGKWEDQQLINASWFDESVKAGAPFMPEYGLLWELLTNNFRFVVDDEQINKMVTANIDGDFIEKARSMKGTYDGYGAYYKKIAEVFGKDYNSILQLELIPYGLTIGRKVVDGVEGYAGIGYLGQYLVVYPKHNLIAVRGINHYEGYNWDTDEVPEFPKLVRNLVE